MENFSLTLDLTSNECQKLNACNKRPKKSIKFVNEKEVSVNFKIIERIFLDNRCSPLVVLKPSSKSSIVNAVIDAAIRESLDGKCIYLSECRGSLWKHYYEECKKDDCRLAIVCTGCSNKDNPETEEKDFSDFLNTYWSLIKYVSFSPA
jgi:hypothetical protein